MAPTVREIIIAVITAAIAAGGAYFKLQSEMAKADVDQLKIMYARIESLEDRVDTLQSTITALSVENAKITEVNRQQKIKIEILKNQIKYSKNAGVFAVYALVEDLHVPAWCKRYDDETARFIMGYINSAYESTYGITREKYVGLSDFEAHPPEIAKEFYKNDMRIIEDKSWDDFIEVVALPDGKYQRRRFWKFFHQIEDGPDLVCGWEVPHNDDEDLNEDEEN